MRNRVITINYRNEIREEMGSDHIGHCKGFALNEKTNQWRVLS